MWLPLKALLNPFPVPFVIPCHQGTIATQLKTTEASRAEDHIVPAPLPNVIWPRQIKGLGEQKELKAYV